MGSNPISVTKKCKNKSPAKRQGFCFVAGLFIFAPSYLTNNYSAVCEFLYVVSGLNGLKSGLFLFLHIFGFLLDKMGLSIAT